MWALDRMGEWSGMQALTSRTKHPKFGPIRIPRASGRALTAPHHGKFRSAFTGQGNVILIPKDATVRTHKTITLNTNPFCEDRGRAFGLTPKQMLWWEKERRICHTVQYELPGRQRFLVANIHATNSPDTRLPDAELRKAVNFVLRGSELEEALIVAGDFNITREQSTTIQELMTAERGEPLDGLRPADRPHPAAPGDRNLGPRLAGRGAHLRRQVALGPRAGRGSARAAAQKLSVRGGTQPELGADRLQRLDHVRDVNVEVELEQLRAHHDLVPVDSGRERRLLQLLLHRFGLEPVEAGGPDEPARVDEARRARRRRRASS